jgi:hypothetical protein
MSLIEMAATVLFLGIVAFVFTVLRRILNDLFGTTRWTYYLGVWLAILMIVSLTGAVDFSGMPPRFMPIVMVPLITAVAIAFKGRTRVWLTSQDQTRFIAPQAFRIVMEVVLWMLYLQGLMPQLMTFEGRNWDIVAGISAVVATILIGRSTALSRQRSVALVFNMIGLALLLNVTIHGIGSTPSALRIFETEPANTLLLNVPWIWLPGFVVPAAYFFHLLSFRRSLLNDHRPLH